MQETVQVSKAKRELEDFKKKHSKAFLYFLEQYEKWQKLKRKTAVH